MGEDDHRPHQRPRLGRPSDRGAVGDAAGGRYWLFYAGNDFATPAYGIGVAVADHGWGPSEAARAPAALDAELVGARPCLGRPGAGRRAAALLSRLFPGTGGYNAFRALLTVGLEFNDGRVEIAELP